MSVVGFVVVCAPRESESAGAPHHFSQPNPALRPSVRPYRKIARASWVALRSFCFSNIQTFSGILMEKPVVQTVNLRLSGCPQENIISLYISFNIS
jgi:hypothetical protein